MYAKNICCQIKLYPPTLEFTNELLLTKIMKFNNMCNK